MRSNFQLLPLLIAGVLSTLVACSDTTPAGTIDDGRPEGTVLVRFLFTHFCDLSAGGTGYLYTDLRVLGGELVDSQRIENGELNFFLPPVQKYALVVVVDGEEIVEEELFWSSDRDVQLDSLVCQ